MRFQNDPEGVRLPIKLDTATNGEYAPIPLAPVASPRAPVGMDSATDNAKRLGLDRRSFLVSACGAATSLLAMNEAYAASGARGGFFQIEPEAALDVQLARSTVDGNEFIFDVQGHFVNPTGAWLKRLPAGAKPLQGFTSSARCEPHQGPGRVRLPALHRARPVRQGRVHGLGHRPDGAVVRPVDARRRTADDRGGGGDGAHRRAAERHAPPAAPWPRQSEPARRPRGHGRARSALQDLGLEDVHAVGARRHRASSWTTTPAFALIEKARKLGIRNIAIHKGLPFGPKSYEHSTCVDIGRVAKRYPDVNFLIYHSGFVADKAEGPVRSEAHRRHRRAGDEPAR